MATLGGVRLQSSQNNPSFNHVSSPLVHIPNYFKSISDTLSILNCHVHNQMLIRATTRQVNNRHTQNFSIFTILETWSLR